MSTGRGRRHSLALATVLALGAATQAHAQGIETPRVPVRTAIKEINTLRAEYADLYNKKDAAALTAMYLPDAVVVRADGTTLVGRAAIGKTLGQEAPGWHPVTITSDTMRVFGNTAWDVGTFSTQAEGDASVSHYLVVLRRGVERWQISSLATVAEPRATATK
jgi:ketosteroid isomerase-like protein